MIDFTQTPNNQTLEDNINWDALNADAAASVSTAKYDTPQRTIFLKVKQGVHNLRIVPSGNRLMRLPYLRLVQHSIPSVTADGKRTTTFCMCWKYLMEDLTSKPTAEDKKNNSYISYLYQKGKLDQENLKKYQDYGCPFCSAFEHMDKLGIAKDVKNVLYPKTQYLWNVYWRQGQMSGDNQIYVWGCSKTQFNTIISFIKLCKEGGKNALDMNTGHDMMMTATGEGFGGTNGRRYQLQFHPIPSPLILHESLIPFDLNEIGGESCKPYQDVINLCKYAHGKLLAELGFTFAGDTALIVAPVTPAEINPVKVTPFPEVQDGTYTKDGMLYDAKTHKPLF